MSFTLGQTGTQSAALRAGPKSFATPAAQCGFTLGSASLQARADGVNFELMQLVMNFLQVPCKEEACHLRRHSSRSMSFPEGGTR